MSTDKMIEDWAKNLGDSSRTSADQDDSGDLKGWSASGPTNEDAARAIYHAIAASTGRRKRSWHWATVAKIALGIKRMSTPRWEEILKAGKTLGLFEVDSTTFKYPILVVLDIEDVEGEDVEDEDVEDVADGFDFMEVEEEVKVQPVRNKDKWKNSKMPEGFTGPQVLKCGHTDWYGEAAHKTAREAGKCCAGYKSVPSWQRRGLIEAVPLRSRRTVEKGKGVGWPGLCCNPDTGFYIGGIGNNCRYSTGKARCLVHGNLNDKGEPHVA